MLHCQCTATAAHQPWLSLQLCALRVQLTGTLPAYLSTMKVLSEVRVNP